jgi:hypothetical protein
MMPLPMIPNLNIVARFPSSRPLFAVGARVLQVGSVDLAQKPLEGLHRDTKQLRSACT